MKYEIDNEGFFVVDVIDESTPENWTSVGIPQPIYTPKFVGKRLETGEWVGEWVDLGPKYTEEQLKWMEAMAVSK